MILKKLPSGTGRIHEAKKSVPRLPGQHRGQRDRRRDKDYQHGKMTDSSLNIQGSGEGSSSFLERYHTDSSDAGGFDGDDLNLDKTLLNEDPLAEDDSDAQSVIATR